MKCQPGITPDWLHSHPLPTPMSMADLVLDAAAACQFVAVGDGDDDRWLEEEWIPSLRQKEKKGYIKTCHSTIFITIYNIYKHYSY